MIHIATDRPDNRAPPVAAPVAMAVMGDEGAVETLLNVSYLTLFKLKCVF